MEGSIDTLGSRLGELLASRRQNPGWEAAYQEIVATLHRQGFMSGLLDVGQRFPNFMLPSAEGRLVALAEELRRGPVVLSFFRGSWCPFCQMMLEALAEVMPRIEAAGASVLALTPETGGLALKLKQRHGGRFEILADVDFGVGLLAGVVFKIPPLYRTRLEAAGFDFPQRHGNGGWCLPVPAVYVIGQDGVISWRFAEADFALRPEPDEIIAALARMGVR